MPQNDDAIPLQPVGSPRHPNQELRSITAATKPIGDPLDLVHVTAAGWAAEILRSKKPQIEMRHCNVFGRNLVYFFVARPAFRPRDGETGSDDITRFPVAFIVRPEKLGAPSHVYPFDTGAAFSGRYLGARQAGVFLQDFALENSLEAAQRMISFGFTSYERYQNGELNPDLDETLEHRHFVARAYLRIAGLAGTMQNLPDDRAATIEIAYGKHVGLAAHASCVVLPEQLLEPAADGGSPNGLRARLAKLKVPFETYQWRAGDTPDSHMEEVRRLVTQRLRRTVAEP